jgi:hypothetical protein
MSISGETKEPTDSIPPSMKYLFVMNATMDNDQNVMDIFTRKDGNNSPNFEFDGKTFPGSDDNGIYEYFYGTIDDFNANYDIDDDEDDAWDTDDIRVCLPRTNDIDIRNMQQLLEVDLLSDPRTYFNLSHSDTEEHQLQEKEIYMAVHINSGTLVLTSCDEDEECDSLTIWLQWTHKRYKQQYAKKINDIKIKMSSFKEDPVDLEKAQKDLSDLITGLAVMILQDKNKNFVGLEDRVKFLNNMKTFFGDNKTKVLWKNDKEKRLANSIGKVFKAFNIRGIYGTEGKRKTRKKKAGRKSRKKKGGRKSRKKKGGRKSRKKKGGRKSRRKTRIKKRRKTKKRRRTRIKRGGFTAGERVKLTHDVDRTTRLGYIFREDIVGTVREVFNEGAYSVRVEFDAPFDWDRALGPRYRTLSLNDNDIRLVPPDNVPDSDEDDTEEIHQSESVPESSSSNRHTKHQGGGKRKKKTRRKRRTRKRQRN